MEANPQVETTILRRPEALHKKVLAEMEVQATLRTKSQTSIRENFPPLQTKNDEIEVGSHHLY